MNHCLLATLLLGSFLGSLSARTILLNTEDGSVTVSGVPYDFGGVLLPHRETLPDGSMQFVFAGDFVLADGDILRGIGPVPAVLLVGDDAFIPDGARIDFSGITVEPGAGGGDGATGGNGGTPGTGGLGGIGGQGGRLGPGGLIYSPNAPVPLSVSLPGVPPAGPGEAGTVGFAGKQGLAGGAGTSGSPGFANAASSAGISGAVSSRALPLLTPAPGGTGGNAAPWPPRIFWGADFLRELFNPGFADEQAFRTAFYDGGVGGDGVTPDNQPDPEDSPDPLGPLGKDGNGGSFLAGDWVLAGGSSGGSGSGGAGGPGGTGGSGGGGGGGGQGEWAEPFPSALADLGGAAADIALSEVIERLVDNYLKKSGIAAKLNVFNIPTFDLGASGGRGGIGGNGGRGGQGGSGGDGGLGGAGGGALRLHVLGQIYFDGEASVAGALGGDGAEGNDGSEPAIAPSSGSVGRAPFPGFGMSTLLAPFSSVVSLIDGPAAGEGGDGGAGGEGASGGKGFPGGDGGHGSGGTLIFEATGIRGTGELFILGGGSEDPNLNRRGASGALYLATNLLPAGSLATDLLTALGITLDGVTTSATRSGPTAPNPFIAGSPSTPTIAELANGAEAFGFSPVDAINLPVDGTNLLSFAPPAAVIAAKRFDVGPAPFDQDYAGYDLVLVFNTRTNALANVSFGAAVQVLDPTTGDPIPDPATLPLSDGLAPFHTSLIRLGGFANDPRFGGSGDTNTGTMDSLQVYAFLVPEDTTDRSINFTLAATNAGNDFRIEVDKFANGETISATFNPAIPVLDTEWVGPDQAGADGNWNTATNWETRLDGVPQSPIVPNNTTAEAFNVGINLGTAQVFQDTRITIDRLGIGSDNGLIVEDGQDLIIEKFNVRPLAGRIENNGFVRLASSGNPTSLRFSGSGMVLTGSGSITTTKDPNNIISGIRDSDSLIQEADHSILASGQLGANRLRIENHGTIRGNAGSSSAWESLTIDPVGNSQSDSPGFWNTATGDVATGPGYSEIRLFDGYFLFENLPTYVPGAMETLFTFEDMLFEGIGQNWDLTDNRTPLLFRGATTLSAIDLTPTESLIVAQDADLNFDNVTIHHPGEAFFVVGNEVNLPDGSVIDRLSERVTFENTTVNGGTFTFFTDLNLPTFGDLGGDEDFEEDYFEIGFRGTSGEIGNVTIEGNYNFLRRDQIDQLYVEEFGVPASRDSELFDRLEPLDHVTFLVRSETFSIFGNITTDGLIRFTRPNGIDEIPVTATGNVLLDGNGHWNGSFHLSGAATNPARLTVANGFTMQGPAIDLTSLFLENRSEISLLSMTSDASALSSSSTPGDLAAFRSRPAVRNTGILEAAGEFGGGQIDNRGGQIFFGEEFATFRNTQIRGGELSFHGFKTAWTDVELLGTLTGLLGDSSDFFNFELTEVVISSPAFQPLSEMDYLDVINGITEAAPFGFVSFDSIADSGTGLGRGELILDDVEYQTHVFIDEAETRGDQTLAPGVQLIFDQWKVGSGTRLLPGAGLSDPTTPTQITVYDGIRSALPGGSDPVNLVLPPEMKFFLSGAVGDNDVVVINQSEISPAQDRSQSTLTLDPPGTASDAPGFYNEGTIRIGDALADRSDTLELLNGHFFNEGGEIQIGPSTFTRANNARITGGRIVSLGDTAEIDARNSTFRNLTLVDTSLGGDYLFDNVTFEISGDFEGYLGGSGEVVGDFRIVSNDTGSFRIESMPVPRDPTVDRVVITPGATIFIENYNNFSTFTSLLNEGTISGQFFELTTPRLASGETFSVNATVPAPDAEIGEVVTLADLGVEEDILLEGIGRIVNRGIIETDTSNDGAEIFINQAVVDNRGGVMRPENFSAVDSIIENTGGEIVATLDAYLTNAIILGGTMTSDSLFIEDGSNGDFGTDSITSLQDVNLTDSFGFGPYIENYATLFLSGTIRGTGGYLFNQGELLIAGTASSFDLGTLDNEGIITLRGGRLDLEEWETFEPTAILQGTGLITIATSAALDGAIQPGLPPGVLELQGPATFAPGARLISKIESADSSAQLRLTESGLAAQPLVGTLEVILADGYTPEPTDTFVLIDCDVPLTGTFGNRANGDRINVPGTGSFQINFGNGSLYPANQLVLSDFSPILYPDIIHVDDGATGSGTGESWTDAFPLLGDALIPAQPGDEIWIAEGTYPLPDRNQSFLLKNGISLFGGFIGTETSRDQRDPSLNLSRIQGAPTPGVPAAPVFLSLANTALTRLDGLLIENGSGTSGPNRFPRNQRRSGGGVHIREGSELQVFDCTFRNNSANERGGAVYIFDASPTISGCTFSENSDIALVVEEGDLTLTACIFADNPGGDIFFDLATGIISGSSFTHPNLRPHAGVKVFDESEVTIEDSRFFNIRSDSDTNAPLVVEFRYNRQQETVFAPTVAVNRCEFVGNDTFEAGGAILNTGDLVVANSLFSGNRAGIGGAIANSVNGEASVGFPRVRDANLTVINSTFANNHSLSAGSGAILFGNLDLRNVVIWGNSAGTVVGSATSSVASPTSMITNNSLLQGYVPSGPGDLDGSTDPLFRSSLDPLLNPQTGGDFRLLPGSPLFDTGNSANAIGSSDLDLLPRIAGAAINIGAYEEQAVFYVDATGGNENGGGTWSSAYTELQPALSAARAGTEIRVAAGTYKPTSGTDRSATFSLPSGVSILGGFPSGGTESDDRDPAANPTLLSGEIGDPGLLTDNVLHVVTGDGLGPATLFDGFTISDGFANGPDATDDNKGGGMLLTGGSNPTLSNLVFFNNQARGQENAPSYPDSIAFGGGLAVIDSSPSLIDVVFEQNLSVGTPRPDSPNGRGHGGAAAFINSTIDLLRVSFFGNEAIGASGADGADGANGTSSSRNGVNGGAGTPGGTAIGGALYGTFSGGMIRESVFRENRVRAGSGGDGGNGGNGATGSAGGTGANGGQGGSGGNGGDGGAAGTSFGGALYLNEQETSIINSRFEGNFTFSPQTGAGGNGGNGGKGGKGGNGENGNVIFERGGDGGNGGKGGTAGSGGDAGSPGRSLGGAIYLNRATLDLINVAMVANHAAAVPNVNANSTGGSAGTAGGGGAKGTGGSGGLFGADGDDGNAGSTGSAGTRGNDAGESRDEGGALIGSQSETRSTNLTLVENRALDAYATIRGFGEVNNTIAFRNFAFLEESSGIPSDTPSGSFGFGGSFLTTDPFFIREPDPGDGNWETTTDNDYGDLRLLFGSAALDNGNNILNPEATDLSGSDRIVDGTIDTGAHEGAYTTFALVHPALDPNGDVNGNGIPDKIDYAIGNNPEGASPRRPTASFDGTTYSPPLAPRTLDVTIRFEKSTDLIDFDPMIEGTDYETGENGEIHLIPGYPVPFFLRHVLEVTPGP